MPKDIAKQTTPVNPIALYCLHLLLYTGARLCEIEILAWKHIDFKLVTIALPSINGDERKPQLVSRSAIEILSDVSRANGSAYVLPDKYPT
ncbi:hypothetical protein [Pseudovibrio sp. SCP19]|uniref:hypothetical protein n=1 Tax=Pseudovibrio sp. SCP19 TaxID=3141374 RepID=UPI003337262F